MDNILEVLKKFEKELEEWSPGPARRRVGITEKEHKWLRANCQPYLDILNKYLDDKNKKRYVSQRYYAKTIDEVTTHKRIDAERIKQLMDCSLPLGVGNLDHVYKP